MCNLAHEGACVRSLDLLQRTILDWSSWMSADGSTRALSVSSRKCYSTEQSNSVGGKKITSAAIRAG
jgi:hypothetical protein